MSAKPIRTLLLAFGIAAASTASALPIQAADQAADAINKSASNIGLPWAVEMVGWSYTPPFSYLLGGIATRFGPPGGPPGRIVTFELYDAPPVAGGVLLRSADFSVDGFDFQEVMFPAIPLDQGEDYFFGFRNVLALGANVTNDAFATLLPPGLYFSRDSGGSYEVLSAPGFTAQPIVQFLEVREVPEPGSLGLLSIALFAALCVQRKSRRLAA